MNRQITTVSILRFEGIQKWWMLSQMQLAQGLLRDVEGLKFFKLMGSGAENGFSIKPNLAAYALVAVWEDAAYADSFFNASHVFERFQLRAREIWTVRMHAFKAHGMWSGQEPFDTIEHYSGGPIAVITRATIKLKYLRKFWSYVPSVSGNLDDRKGLLFSIGIGEYPLIMQSTFSVWDSMESMRDYAYKSTFHKEVVRKTRELGWYKEELFANFIPFNTTGTLNGKNPLAFTLSGSSN